MRLGPAILLAVAAALVVAGGAYLAQARRPPRNVILFVADGLRSGIVTPQTAPALAAVRDQGVDFRNSHSIYPTVTTANASAMATGHYLGDTGNFANILYVGPEPLGFPVLSTESTMEDDAALGLMNKRYGGDYLTETSWLAAARAQGFSTAAVGKLGPVAIQDVTARDGAGTVIIDDQTGVAPPDGLPLSPDLSKAIKAAGLPLSAPDRGLNTDPGAYNMPGVRVANIEQQDWFTKVVTDVLLPRFKAAGKPFALVFWSRDPDGTQHNQGDSLNTLTPGINGPTTMAAIRNVSNDLQRIRDALKAQGLDKTTDIVVTADHGFSTISKQSRTSAAARLTYRDVPPGFLPPGFLAIDLSLAQRLPLWNPTGLAVPLAEGFHPKGGNALLGADPDHPDLAVTANGGTDFIYLTGKGDARAMARKIVALISAEDYAGGLFVNDDLGPIPGTLPMSLINLKGGARTPQPSIVVEFASRAGGCARADTCQILVADTDLQQGQGNHGSFGRGDTHNFMAAIGPDFKSGFVDSAPVSNADIAWTLARAAGLKLPAKGKLVGRVMSEALKGGAPAEGRAEVVRSRRAANGFMTVLDGQEAGGVRYFDAAGMPGRVLGVRP
jgi:arylsulfatase A-like enzyme